MNQLESRRLAVRAGCPARLYHASDVPASANAYTQILKRLNMERSWTDPIENRSRATQDTSYWTKVIARISFLEVNREMDGNSHVGGASRGPGTRTGAVPVSHSLLRPETDQPHSPVRLVEVQRATQDQCGTHNTG